MQKITYAGDEYLIGDEIADALMAFSRALGDDDRAEVVEIPIRDTDGSVVTAKFLIGPASQIVSRPAKERGPEIRDEELVQRLRQRTRGVEAPSGQPLEAPEANQYDIT